MALVRPRLTDHYNIALGQEDADFAIPFLDEDIPLCVDPFLLWKSPSMQDNSLYAALVNSFNYLGHLVNKGDEDKAIAILTTASECNEVGLGFSDSRQGTRIGQKSAKDILSLFRDVPQIQKHGFVHFEEIQLYVDQVSRDRISDIACSFLKSFLIDYTMERCEKHGVPLTTIEIRDVYDLKGNTFLASEKVKLPTNPETNLPVLLVPKRWLRGMPWINCDDYIGSYVPTLTRDRDRLTERISILNFNRHNYDLVQVYVKQKERTAADCKNDPLFRPIPVLSAKRKFDALKKLPSGKTGNADKQYEDLVCQLMASLLYPHLDFADDQVRTDSGAQIRDLIFYNNRSVDFFQDIHRLYDSRQIVMELKNVKEVERDHINQLNRYLKDEFGRFGILITRNRLTTAMFRNTIDLWAGQRRCLVVLTDEDLALMVSVFESRQRLPIEVIKAKYLEFARACPS